MKKTISILFFISFLSYGLTNQTILKNYEIVFKCKTDDNKYKDPIVSLFEISTDKKTLVKTFSNTYKNKLQFEYQKDYLVSFEKAGYIKKEISVSTKNISKERWNKEFAKLFCNINLSKQPKDSIVQHSRPVSIISYSDTLGDFDIKFDKINK
ncbi:MAG: hypothetical protein A3F72_03865 [Bacteroidetes bacterium RIFCSPLOWO2_12_FULL_35_15]|nr:MAG: hypothetical protein A3F72_03865 [Bacteroidetes bacterium RIFCSPLOWO2_12_FULL_35_15]